MTAPEDQSRTLPDGSLGPRVRKPLSPSAKYMRVVPDYCDRAGCAPITVERRIKNDPEFPLVIYFGRLRYLEVEAVEKYEAICKERAITRAAEKAAAKAAKGSAKEAATSAA